MLHLEVVTECTDRGDGFSDGKDGIGEVKLGVLGIPGRTGPTVLAPCAMPSR